MSRRPFAATALGPGGPVLRVHEIFGHGCSLAVPILGDGQEVGVIGDDDQSDYAISIGEPDAFDPGGGSPHDPGIAFIEPDRHAVGGAQQYVVVAMGLDDSDQFIAIVEIDRVDAATFTLR